MWGVCGSFCDLSYCFIGFVSINRGSFRIRKERAEKSDKADSRQDQECDENADHNRERNDVFFLSLLLWLGFGCLLSGFKRYSDGFRRHGAASLLFGKAEEIAGAMGEDTVYNFVHPNNEGMIAFLRSKGYTVLNMIEVRKPYGGEKLTTKVRVNENAFDY